MAENAGNAIVKLTPQMKKELEALDTDIQAAKDALKVLERLDMGTAEVRNKLAWAENVRSELLKEFG